MFIQLRRMAAISALAIGAAAVSAIPLVAQEQEHRDSTAQRDYNSNNNQSDYSNNQFYRLGNQEGLQDHQRNKRRASHNHKYKTDDDRKAHDYGYQEGWQGRNYRAGDHDRDRDRDHEDPH